jgi:hypothetical protein
MGFTSCYAKRFRQHGVVTLQYHGYGWFVYNCYLLVGASKVPLTQDSIPENQGHKSHSEGSARQVIVM